MTCLKYLFFLAIILFATLIWIVQDAFLSPNNLDESTSFVIARGIGSRQVANDLQQAGIIQSPLLFRLYARVYKLDKHLKAGEYLFTPHLSMKEVLEIIAKGEVYYRKITLPEGLTTQQIFAIINAEENLSGKISLTINEGEILPETYNFSKGDSRDSILLQAKKAMEKVLDDAWMMNQEQTIKNKKELLILASIIEKETGVASERNDIAAVFINRLKKGMKLQTDPTVIYAITLGKIELDRQLYKKDLEIDSPYNTYRYYGLPPEPICNPGKEAIFASVNPSNVDYIFFVATGNGGHNFAKNLNEHNNNVSIYRQRIKTQ